MKEMRRERWKEGYKNRRREEGCSNTYKCFTVLPFHALTLFSLQEPLKILDSPPLHFGGVEVEEPSQLRTTSELLEESTELFKA